jgi:glycyl-tRNA synthetase
MEHSKENLEYLDPDTNQKYVPYVVEPSVGVGRMLLAILFSAYDNETLENGDTREVLRLAYHLAPYKVAILPLIKKVHADKANEIFAKLSKAFPVTYDESAAIGKRYRRQDSIGTPFCLTVDDNTLNNNTVTLRDRDTMQQVTLNIDEVIDYVNKKLEF